MFPRLCPDFPSSKGYSVLKILLVDDHELFRVGIRLLLDELAPDVSCTEVADARAALELPPGPELGLILLDLHLPGGGGLALLPQLKQRHEAAAIVVLSGEESVATIRTAIDTGAAGYIPKTSSPAVMIAALRLVLAGGTYLPPHMLAAVGSTPLPPIQGNNLPGAMTARQMETLRLAMRGKPNKMIAREMDISEATVKAHLATAFRVLGVRNRTEAVFAAAKLGLVAQEQASS